MCSKSAAKEVNSSEVVTYSSCSNERLSDSQWSNHPNEHLYHCNSNYWYDNKHYQFAQSLMKNISFSTLILFHWSWSLIRRSIQLHFGCDIKLNWHEHRYKLPEAKLNLSIPELCLYLVFPSSCSFWLVLSFLNLNISDNSNVPFNWLLFLWKIYFCLSSSRGDWKLQQ